MFVEHIRFSETLIEFHTRKPDLYVLVPGYTGFERDVGRTAMNLAYPERLQIFIREHDPLGGVQIYVVTLFDVRL